MEIEGALSNITETVVAALSTLWCGLSRYVRTHAGGPTLQHDSTGYLRVR